MGEATGQSGRRGNSSVRLRLGLMLRSARIAAGLAERVDIAARNDGAPAVVRHGAQVLPRARPPHRSHTRRSRPCDQHGMSDRKDLRVV